MREETSVPEYHARYVDLQDSLSQNNIATYVCTRTITSCTQPFTSSLSSSEKVTATCKTGIRKHQTSLAIKGEIRLKKCHLDHQPKFLSLNSPHPFYCNSGLCEHQDRTTMTALKIFLVVAALHFCPSLGAKYNCTQKYQKLLREAGVVKAQCPNAALHDCCQVRCL